MAINARSDGVTVEYINDSGTAISSGELVLAPYDNVTNYQLIGVALTDIVDSTTEDALPPMNKTEYVTVQGTVQRCGEFLYDAHFSRNMQAWDAVYYDGYSNCLVGEDGTAATNGQVAMTNGDIILSGGSTIFEPTQKNDLNTGVWTGAFAPSIISAYTNAYSERILLVCTTGGAKGTAEFSVTGSSSGDLTAWTNTDATYTVTDKFQITAPTALSTAWAVGDKYWFGIRVDVDLQKDKAGTAQTSFPKVGAVTKAYTEGCYIYDADMSVTWQPGYSISTDHGQVKFLLNTP